MSFSIITAEEFQKHYETASEQPFHQTIEMANLLQNRGFAIEYVGYKVNNDIKVSALLYTTAMFGGKHMEINYGPIITDDKYLAPFYQGLTTYAKQTNVLQLILRPNDTYQSFDMNGQPISNENHQMIKLLTDAGFHHDGLKVGMSSDYGADWHYLKDLSQLTEDTLFDSYHKKGKALVKKAHSFGIQLTTLKREELHRFKAITSATSERRDYDDKSLEYYQTFYDHFGDKAEFMMASINFKDYLDQVEQGQQQVSDSIANLKDYYQDNQDSSKFKRMLKDLTKQYETFEVRRTEALSLIDTYGDSTIDLAGSLFIYGKTEAVYLFSGSLTEFNRFYAPALLQEHVMTKAIQKNIPIYNFLGIHGIFDGTDGVLRFKQNFNGYINRKAGIFRYYPRPLKLKAIQFLKSFAYAFKKG
ncbi:aminoacyltransferase [Streptococcus fryi]